MLAMCIVLMPVYCLGVQAGMFSSVLIFYMFWFRSSLIDFLIVSNEIDFPERPMEDYPNFEVGYYKGTGE